MEGGRKVGADGDGGGGEGRGKEGGSRKRGDCLRLQGKGRPWYTTRNKEPKGKRHIIIGYSLDLCLTGTKVIELNEGQ